MALLDVALLQTDISWRSPLSNMENISAMVHEHTEALGSAPGLIVLPEMFDTGFCMEPDVAELPAREGTLEWMRSVAADYDTAVAGSMAVRARGMMRNRFFFVRPDGTYEYYDKRHLFRPGGEGNHFEAGDKRVVVQWQGVRILLQVCYDLRFPVFARNRGDYDMIIYLASWPIERIGAWETLLRARAIENSCYVAGVNRVGSDPGGLYDGRSAIVDYTGATLTPDAVGVQTSVTARIDTGKLSLYRRDFPVAADADRFTMTI